jgi:hypothetical protein
MTVSYLISAEEMMTVFGHLLNNNHSNINLIVECASMQVSLGVFLQEYRNTNLVTSTISTKSLQDSYNIDAVIVDQERKHRRLEPNDLSTEVSFSFDVAAFLTSCLRTSGGKMASESRVLIPSKMFEIEAYVSMETSSNSNNTLNNIDIQSLTNLAHSLLLLDSGGIFRFHASALWSEAIAVVSRVMKPVLTRSIVSGLAQHVTGVDSSSSSTSSVVHLLSTSLLSLLGQDIQSMDPLLTASLRLICNTEERDAICLSISKSLNPSCDATECLYKSRIEIGNSDEIKPTVGPRHLADIPTHALNLSPLGLSFETAGKVVGRVSSILEVAGSSNSVFLDAALAKALNIARGSNYSLSGILSVATTVDMNWFHYNWNNKTNNYEYDNRTTADVSTSSCGTVSLFISGEQRIGQTVTIGLKAELDASGVNRCIDHLLTEYGISSPYPSLSERDLFVTSSGTVDSNKLGGLVQLQIVQTNVGIGSESNVIGRLSAPLSLNKHLWAISNANLPQSSFPQNISADSGSIKASLSLPLVVYQLPQFEHFSSVSGASIKNQPIYQSPTTCTDILEINNEKKGAYFHNLAYAGCDDGSGLPSREATQGPCISAFGSKDVVNVLSSIFPSFVQSSSLSSSYGRVNLIFKESDKILWGASGNENSLPSFLNYVSVTDYAVSGCISLKNSSSHVNRLPSTLNSFVSFLQTGKVVTFRVDSSNLNLSSSPSPYKRALPPSDLGCPATWQVGFQTQCGGELLLRILRMFSSTVDDFYATFKSAKVNPVGTIQNSWRNFLKYTWPQLSTPYAYISLMGERYLDEILTGLRKLVIGYPVMFINSLQIESGTVQADVFVLNTNNNESVAWVNASTLNGGYVRSGSINSSRISSLDISCKLINRAVTPAPLWAKLSGSVYGKDTSSFSTGASPIRASIHMGYLFQWFDLIASRFPIYKFLSGSTEAYLYKDYAVTTLIVKAIDYWSSVETTNTSCFTRNGASYPSSSPKASATPSPTLTPSRSALPSSSSSSNPSPSFVPASSDANEITQRTAIFASSVAGALLIVALGGFIFARYRRGRGICDVFSFDSQKPSTSVNSSKKNSHVDVVNSENGRKNSISTKSIEDWHSRPKDPKSSFSPLPLYSQ